MIFSGNYEQFCEQLIQHVFIVYFYTTWQIPSVSFLCNDSYSPRGPKQHRIIGSTRTALGRTAPHISSWIFHQTKGLISLSVICYQPVSMGTCYDLTILITNYLCSIYYSLGTPLYLQLIGNGQVGQQQWNRISGSCPPWQESDNSDDTEFWILT